MADNIDYPLTPAMPSDNTPNADARAGRDNTALLKQHDKKSPGIDLEMKGRFDRYNSPFLKLMIPLLTTRYVWLAVEGLNPFGLAKKSKPNNFAAIGMGATAIGAIGFYSQRTYEDIKTLYAEAVGYELDKKPQDINFADIFFKSQNAALKVTREAFIKRTGARLATASAFLVPWHWLKGKTTEVDYTVNMNAGVGAVGAHLSLNGFMRTPSFFDAEQSLAGTAIGHIDTNTHEIIESKHIESLLMLQRKHLNKDYKWPKLNSVEGEQQTALASRIADLLNQGCDNIPVAAENVKNEKFTIGKFNYLIGMGLLDKPPAQSMGFVELANKSSGMKEVNAVANAIGKGQDARVAFQAFGIDLLALPKKNAPIKNPEPATKFTTIVKPAQKSPLTPRTHQDFAAQAATGLQLNP